MDYNTVSVVDLAAGLVTDSIPVGGRPRGIALSPGGGRAYVTNGADASVSVISTATNTVIAVVDVGFGSGPARVALNSSGSRAYVSNNGLHTVSVIDTSRNVVVATVDPAFGLLDGPFGIVVHPSRSLAFIANMWGGGVTIMDTGANVIRTRIALPIYPDPDMSLMYAVGLDPTGSSLFAAGFSVDGYAWLSTIDINTNLVTSNVSLSDFPCGMVVR
jgi:YVTN family beta-propeller protein